MGFFDDILGPMPGAAPAASGGFFDAVLGPAPPLGWRKVGPWWVNPATGERKPIPGAVPEGAIPDTEVDATSPFELDLGDVGRSALAGVADMGSAAVGAARLGRDAALATPLALADITSRVANKVAPSAGAWIDRAMDSVRERDEEVIGMARRPFETAAQSIQPETPATMSERPLQAILEGGARSLPTTAALLASGGLALPAAGLLEGSQAYEGTLERGPDRGAAMGAAGAGGVVNAALERLGLDSILGKVAGKSGANLLSRVAQGFAGEGLTEAAQELTHIAAEAATGKEITRDEIQDRVALALGAGGVSGSALSAASMAVQTPPPNPDAPPDLNAGSKWKQAFSAYRGLPEPFVQAKEAKDAHVRRDVMEASHLQQDYEAAERAYADVFGVDRDEAAQVMHRYLTGKIDIEAAEARRLEAASAESAAEEARLRRAAERLQSRAGRLESVAERKIDQYEGIRVGAEVDYAVGLLDKADELRSRRERALVRREDAEAGSARLKRLADAHRESSETLDAMVPPEMRAVLDPMRSYADSFSLRLINEEGVLPSWMKTVYGENLGEHIRRDYLMNDYKDWRQRIAGTDREKVGKDFLRQELADDVFAEYSSGQGGQSAAFDDYLEQRVEGEFTKLLDRDKNPFYMLGGSGLGTLDPSTLSIRKDIPKELRYAMGEIYDPGVLLLKTVERSARTLHTARMYSAIRDAGLDEVFFEQPQGEFSRQLPGERFSRSPLGGLYTTPQLAEVLDSAFAEAHQGAIMGFINTYVNGIPKAGVTVGSLPSTNRNLFGNIQPLVANGHVNPMSLARGLRVAWDAAGFKSKSEWSRQEALDMAEYGLTGGTIDTRDVDFYTQSVAEKLSNGSRGATIANWLMAPFGAGQSGYSKARKGLYQMMDLAPKYAAFVGERSRFADAMGLSPNDPRVKARAAEVVKQTMQNYDRLPAAAEVVKQIPMVGPFVSFRVGTIQNAANTMKLMFDEIRDPNPKIREIGAKRLGGIMAAIASPAAATAAATAMFGLDDWDEEDQRGLRATLPQFLRLSSFVPFSNDRETGQGTVMDLGYMDYYGALRRPVMAWLRAGEVGEESIDAAMDEVLKDTFGEELGVGAFMSLQRNQDEFGEPVYDEDNPDRVVRYLKKAKFLAKRLAPGDVRTALRVKEGVDGEFVGGMKRDLVTELVAIGGPRLYNFDARRGIQNAARKTSAGIKTIRDSIDDSFNDSGAWSSTLTARQAANGEERTVEKFRQLQEVLRWAREKQGVPQGDAAAYMEFGNLSKRDTGRALTLDAETAGKQKWADMSALHINRAREKMVHAWRESLRTDLQDATPRQIQKAQADYQSRWTELWLAFYPDSQPPPLDLPR